jgi:hypothetical protein
MKNIMVRMSNITTEEEVKSLKEGERERERESKHNNEK